MSSSNPFSVLGFAPSAFKDLRDEEIMSLVEAQYRSLVGLYHPDRKRLASSKRFREVQEAMEMLREPSSFAFAKQIFCRNRKDRAVAAEEEKASALKEIEALNQTLVDFWFAFFSGTCLTYSQSDAVKGISVFGHPKMRILVADHFGRLLISRAVKQNRKEFSTGTVHPLMVQYEGDALEGYYELRVSEDGTMTRQNLVRAPFQFKKGWKPPVEPDLVYERKTRSSSYYWEDDGEPERIFGKLIGSIPINSFTPDQRSIVNPELIKLLPGTVSPESFDLVKDGFTFDEFSGHLRHIKPIVQSNSYLIVLQGKTREHFRFLLIGSAKKFLPVKSKK